MFPAVALAYPCEILEDSKGEVKEGDQKDKALYVTHCPGKPGMRVPPSFLSGFAGGPNESDRAIWVSYKIINLSTILNSIRNKSNSFSI